MATMFQPSPSPPVNRQLRATLLTLPLAFLPVAGASAAPLQFNRDIRPILSENCFQCHGQDRAHREAKLRLDEFESATQDRDGFFAIVPGNPEQSEMIVRILSDDESERMPPRESNKHISPAQVAILKQWISEGAAYERHWAFLAPRRPAVPENPGISWGRSPIDAFVLQRLRQEKLSPSPEAKPAAWLRRVSFDLVGLPPTPQELDAFSADAARRGETAYSEAVDRLMRSPHFGERLAMDWLDAARYADTHGFNNDSTRTMWRWRDWVIEAFNSNKPYSEFITEQLAGDLLPSPSLDQRIATGFNRNHVISSEGGIIDEEYRIEYVADRIRTVSTAWLGLTFECARCHDHKFDPIEQRDYYRLSAFFNNVPEWGEDGRVANAVPMIPAPTRAQQVSLARLEKEQTAAKKTADAARTAWRWEESFRSQVEQLAAAARTATDNNKSITTIEIPPPDAKVQASVIPGATFDFAHKDGLTVAFWLRPAAGNPSDVALLSGTNHQGSPADTSFGKGREIRLIDGELELRIADRLPVYSVTVRTDGAGLRPEELHHVAVTYTGGRTAADVRMYVDGREVACRTLYDDLHGGPGNRDFLVATDNATNAARFLGTVDDLRRVAPAASSETIRTLFRATSLPRALTAIDAGGAKPHETRWLADALLAEAPGTRDDLARETKSTEGLLALRRTLPTTMVMEEMDVPRQTYLLLRGNYDAHGEKLDAGVPEKLLAPWPKGAPKNRLGLARWFTQPDHPLTGRVVVNRFWAQLFGTGLVKTLEDFGSQSEWPSHPELLDWLAREFVDGGWNVKAFLKELVLSSTYRQSSAVSADLAARDPENRLLARGPRVRLPAELIRDQALAVSGLLAARIGGPSVFPYQPEGLYDSIVVDAPYPGTKWLLGSGEDLHRRSLYTFWKRTMPHPMMLALDAPDREFCTVRRSRTNTPLQALALWNETGYVEAARRLATRMMREGGPDDSARAAFAFQASTGRRPGDAELQVILKTWEKVRTDFAAHPADAETFVAHTGASAIDAMIPPVELAAATSVASMILSLDETLTKD
ncbi:MAG: DUF1553 domain-containing protein [Opitutaceae bacterium]|nr:DUF1553 domain-containing protein [Opitutaceae bacterium]